LSARASKARTLAAVLVVTLVATWLPRSVEGIRRPRPEGGWFSIDPDGVYHARRVERALDEGLPVAGTDPYLAFPEGARIPWPPYYDTLLALALRPFAPVEASRRRELVETAVSTFPTLFALASAALAVLAVWRLTLERETGARAAGALAAGVTYALCRASINYSVLGTGDHHAWTSLLDAGLLVSFSAAAGGSLRSGPRGLAWGAGCGLLAGLMLGSWVAALLYVLNVQLALAWLLFRRAREPLPGVATFGFAFHAVGALTILPAALASPWREEFPWTVVNLSLFHPLQLGLGALVFVPPLLFGRRALAAGTGGARRYPWIVGAALVALGSGLWLLRLAPARGVAEGFAWVSRANSFMDTVLESAPLLGPRSEGAGQLFLALGIGVLALPFAWAAMAWGAVRRHRLELLPWVVALPPLLVQALAQRRFGDALAVPMAVALGWALARWVRGPRVLLAAAALAAALVLQLPSLLLTVRQWPGIENPGSVNDVRLGERELYGWIASNTPGTGDYSVLAHWDRGHMIEWVADRPSVATGFGSYVGVESYRAPSRFYLAEDPFAARAVLEERRARYVIVPASLPRNLESMIRMVDPELRSLYLTAGPEGPVTTLRWLSTMGARLLSGGVQVVPPGTPREQRSNPLGFLRLVYVSPFRDPLFRDPGSGQELPVGTVWERVPGARIAARGRPGEEARIALRISYAAADYALELIFTSTCDDAGIARFWVPYATDRPGGDGAVERARWSIGADAGELTIPESAVLGGPSLTIP